MIHDKYKKIVYWSDEDECYIGVCPELMYGGVHGDDPVEVFRELNEAVEETIEIILSDGNPLPMPQARVMVEAI
ncbi:MAG: type II toxin-antitoxin system HicB family antitoxin [Pyrinomonadaceae bacterium]